MNQSVETVEHNSAKSDAVKCAAVHYELAQRHPAPVFASHASVTSFPQVFLFENHDQALNVWQRAGVTGRILIHVDPHHDMWWIAPDADKGISFANYVCRALTEGIAREVFWVVPERSWRSARNRRQIVHQLRAMLLSYPGERGEYEMRRDSARVTIMGKRVEVCSLGALPEFSEPVLLDIDVDFFVLRRIADSPSDRHASLPCCWPQDLVRQISSRKLRWDLATISYSVEGGYTPLRWKYLGDELALLLRGCTYMDDVRIRAMAHLRIGAEAEIAGELSRADAAYRDAAVLWPESAAPLLCLALLHQQRRDLESARRLYREALDRDPAYRTIYNSEGLWHYWDGRREEAEEEFCRALEIDPGNSTSVVGLSWLAVERKDWAKAAALLDALPHGTGASEPMTGSKGELAFMQLDACRALGETMQRLEKRAEAIAAYERSLRLALAGEQSHKTPSLIYSGSRRLLDSNHWDVFVRLGELYREQGDNDAAMQRYRMALAAGYDSVVLRRELLHVALRLGGEFGLIRQAREYTTQLIRAGLMYIRNAIGRRLIESYEFWRAW